jgi:glutamate/tyrosine decarboxylase-like PLP-dependent enzyme
MDPALLALLDALEGFDPSRLPLIPTVSAQRLRDDLARRFDPDAPRPLDALVGDVCEVLRAGLTHSTHPRHFGLFNPTAALPSVVADALVARFNPQLSVWQAAPAAVEMEQLALAALASRMGLDPACAKSFTTGGAEANHTALALALARAVPGYTTDGLAGSAVRPVVYASSEAHASITKAAQVTGLGRNAVRHVAVDRAYRMSPRALRQQIALDRAEGRTPAMIVATVGTTSAGAIDPLPNLALIAKEEGAWLHVDAAWGGIAALSPRTRPLLDGVREADSVTWDAHKALPVAMGAGMFFCNDSKALRDTFAVEAPYMMRGDDARVQPYQSSMQWSRRFAGLKVLLTLASMGWRAIEAMVERQFALADRLRAGLIAGGWEVVNDTALPVVCFTHEAIRKGRTTTKKALQPLWRDGVAWVSETRLDGRVPCLRACVTNVDSREEDVDALIAGVTRKALL